MQAVQDDADYVLRWPVTCTAETARFTKTVKAKQVWDKFVDAAWASAEPGALFWDTVLNRSLADCYADVGFNTTSTNPCCELPLTPDDSCRLIVLNLFSFVNNPLKD